MPADRHPRQNLLLGIAFALAGTLLFSITDATGKWLTAGYPIMQISWIRSCAGLFLIGLFALLTGRTAHLKTKNAGGHLLRSCLSAGLIMLIFYSLKHIPIAEYVSLTFAAPFIIALLSPLVLREQVDSHSWLAIVLGFIGILIVLRPTPDHFHIAHVAALFVALGIALLSITARLMAKSETALALNFYIYPVNMIVAAWWAIDAWVPPDLLDWLLFLMLGATGTGALGCFIQALRYARPAALAPIDYARMVWMISFGYLIWGEVPAMITWLGIALIIASGIYVVSHGRKIPELEMGRETNTGAL